MPEINPNEVYTTQETELLLKISKSTIKRLLKRGAIRANKVGGHYRISGKELLRVISPAIEQEAASFYREFKRKTKHRVKKW